MHKFFCNYNNLTESYELSQFRNMGLNRSAIIQAENTLLPQIQQTIQSLYENVVLLKEKESDENRLRILDETELMISNLFYSLFTSPLELVDDKKQSSGNAQTSLQLINELIKMINIPEYNRLCILIKNNLESL